MNITGVEVSLPAPGDEGNPKVLGYAKVVFDDCFVVRNVRVIDSARGPLVCMPSRRLGDTCPNCRRENSYRRKYCGECGNFLGAARAPRDPAGRAQLFADICHPVTTEMRHALDAAVLGVYREELAWREREGPRGDLDGSYRGGVPNGRPDDGGAGGHRTVSG